MKPEERDGSLNIVGSELYNKGFKDGMWEEGSHPGIQAHDSMDIAYRAGFSTGAHICKSIQEGWNACKTLNVSCYRLTEIDEPWMSEDWVNGMWEAFADEDAKGFSA